MITLYQQFLAISVIKYFSPLRLVDPHTLLPSLTWYTTVT